MIQTKPRRTTARRIAGAFGLVLLLFALALIVMIVALDRIGAAEEEVARFDRAKHAGHHAVAMAREQYMHQAHTMLAWDDSHMDHYADIAKAAQHATEHLEHEVAGHPGAAQAREISRLISWCQRDRCAWLQIDDHGPGIPPEAMARTFEPFFTTRTKGHGLGLAIARTLARAHAGDVHLEPRLDGQGTRASLSLPLGASGTTAAA